MKIKWRAYNFKQVSELSLWWIVNNQFNLSKRFIVLCFVCMFIFVIFLNRACSLVSRSCIYMKLILWPESLCVKVSCVTTTVIYFQVTSLIHVHVQFQRLYRLPQARREGRQWEWGYRYTQHGSGLGDKSCPWKATQIPRGDHHQQALALSI